MFYSLYTLVIKELQSLLRNPQTRATLIVPVLFQMTLFPWAATLEVKNATIAIYNEDKGQASIELTQRLAKSKAFPDIILLTSSQEIRPTLDNRKALLLVRFPQNFSANIASQTPTSIQVLLDGRNSNSAQISANYIQQIVMNYQKELSGNSASLNNSDLIIRNWYNANLDYKWFVVPSLVAMITTIGVLIVTALSVAREREQGTLDQLLVAPLATWQIFLGKAIPALVVATTQASIVLLIGTLFYQIHFAGSLLLFYGCTLVYGLSLVGFGLLISAVCSTQQQAFIGVFVFMMPAILLSGYISPVENMPVWLQDITWVNPIRHFTDITKQIYLKGADFSVIWHSLWPLLVITVTTGGIAYRLFRSKIA
ncbi:ABC transporter permease [Xenorhabdus sp. XENO-7]|uniref:Transport permease protein n=1 Tax=Xenorhabdus aichiensis TaxID=3025874 RepID=A0ABT5LYP2_9GAMM|nr:ABC transporter permease [Xenorhabdus aichiensis]MDC9620542.1 ABC transporter permease [Xenorhabdus aichiensis]